MIKSQLKISGKICAILLSLLLIFEQSAFAQVAAELNIAGHLSSLHSNLFPDKFRPLHLRYLSYDNLNNQFKLLLDKGDLKNPQTQELENTTKDLLNYVFIGITLPNDSFWVNLRPDAEDNIIDSELAKTDVGKILLEADLQLKKDTAKFTSPETPEGKQYWDKLYQKAGELFGSENITIPTLTRPWIIPGEIIIREAQDNAYIYKATLKVMLEQDYLKNSALYSFKDERLKVLNEYSSSLIRELIIPKLTKEVNSAKRYAPLRQVYYSLILAQWFKQRFYGKGGLYSWLIDKKNLNGLTSKIPWSKTTYFQAYQKSFKDGEYSLKEPTYTPYGQTIRSYFSGGIAIQNAVTREKPTLPAKGPIPESVLRENILATGQGGTPAKLAAEKVHFGTGIDKTVKPPSVGSAGEVGMGGIGFKLNIFNGIVARAKQLGSGETLTLTPQEMEVILWGLLLTGVNAEGRAMAQEVNEQISSLISPKIRAVDRQALLEMASKWYDPKDKHKLLEKLRFAFQQVTAQPPDAGTGQVNPKATGWGGGRFSLLLDNVEQLIKDGKIGKARDEFMRIQELMNEFRRRYRGTEDEAVRESILREFEAKLGVKDPDMEDIVGDFEPAQARAKVLAAEIQKLESAARAAPTLSEAEGHAVFSSNIPNDIIELAKNINAEDLYWIWTHELLDSNKPWREQDVKNIQKYRMIVSNDGVHLVSMPDETDGAGLYRDKSIGIVPMGLNTIPASEVEKEMVNFINWLNRQEKQISKDKIEEFVAEAFLRFVIIHPFTDVNGRTARFLLNILLLRHRRTTIDLGLLFWSESPLSYDTEDIKYMVFLIRKAQSGQSMKGYLRYSGRISRQSIYDIDLLKADHISGAYFLDFIYQSSIWGGLPLLENTIAIYNKTTLSIQQLKEFLRLLGIGVRRRWISESIENYRRHYDYFMNILQTRQSMKEPLAFEKEPISAPADKESEKSDKDDTGSGGGAASSGVVPRKAPETTGDIVDPSLRSGSIPPVSGKAGGIDFRALPIVTQAIGNLRVSLGTVPAGGGAPNHPIGLGAYSLPAGTVPIDLDKEWQEIERMLSSGITPSTERLKGYLQASCAKGKVEQNKDKIIGCIAEVLRSEEERCCSTEPLLEDILVVLESGRSEQELSSIFLGNG